LSLKATRYPSGVGRFWVVLVVTTILLLNLGLLTIPIVANGPSTPYVSTIVRTGATGGTYTHPPDGSDTVKLTDTNGVDVSGPDWGYDPSSGQLGPLVVDIPGPSGGGPTGLDQQHDYEITIQWTGTCDPVFVGGRGDTQGGEYFWSVSGTTLTIKGKSVLTTIKVNGNSYDRYVLAFIVFFSSATVTSGLSENNGGMVCFHALDFSISEGERPGILVISVTGYVGQTSGFVKLFMPASVPAQFGKTLDDVVITVDGAQVTATTTDTSSLVQKNGVAVTGRLWEFTVTFSTKTIKSNPNPGRATVGGIIVPVNALTFLVPYLTMVGLVAAVSSAYILRRRSRQRAR